MLKLKTVVVLEMLDKIDNEDVVVRISVKVPKREEVTPES